MAAVSASNVFRSALFYWLIGIISAIYFCVSFDFQGLRQLDKVTVSGILEQCGFRGLNLGIDLRGGTRLILKVDVEQAMANRLTDAGRNIESFVKRKARITAENKTFVNQQVILGFASAAEAFKAYEVITANFKEYEVKQEDEKVAIGLGKAEQERIKHNVVEQAVVILRTRLDTIGVKSPSVSRHGDFSIVVQLPGLDDLAEIKQIIMRSARLEFKIVQDFAGSKLALLNRYDGILPSDMIILEGKSDREFYLVSVFADVSGSHIVSASLGHDQWHKPAINFGFDSEGARDMQETTRNNINRRLAIIMDNRVVQAATINSEISSSGQITGVDAKEGAHVALLLRSGSLDAPLKIESENRVGASLGRDSINQGLMACLVALLMLFVFSLVYYKTSGLLAMLALAINLFVTLIMLALFGATLTLPGIAGMVLTVGMAIDSSILIFEHIKGELANSVSYRKAVEQGFDGAMAVILDSNITTFVAGIVLFKFGGPAIKGFAVTLMLGVLATVMTGVFFLRSCFEFLLDVCGFKKIAM